MGSVGASLSHQEILFRLSLIAITRRDAGKFGFLIMIS